MSKASTWTFARAEPDHHARRGGIHPHCAKNCAVLSSRLRRFRETEITARDRSKTVKKTAERRPPDPRGPTLSEAPEVSWLAYSLRPFDRSIVINSPYMQFGLLRIGECFLELAPVAPGAISFSYEVVSNQKHVAVGTTLREHADSKTVQMLLVTNE
uniref:hypothetical protein n=1 Tax=Cryobacterium sp. TaxID=1926290 RepID=UPI0015EFD606|nr:hypothetical protein [Cryobacterium sp.]